MFLKAYDLKGHLVLDRVWGVGETFLSFLQKNKMPLELYYKLDPEDEKVLMDIDMATKYQIVRDENGTVDEILLPVSDELQLHISRDENGSFNMRMIPIIYQTKKKRLLIKFNDIPSKEIMKKSDSFELAVAIEQLFKKSVDFTKIRKGEHLALLYDEKIRMGKPFGEPKIEAAMIEAAGKTYYRFLALDGRYYDQKGRSSDKSSFIVPCKYKRISSPFTNKRWHPILHRYRAHHGIDYATPVGTPVHAAYNGKVIFAGKKGGYGNVVIIRHPGGYKTYYAHLSRFKTHVGKRVKTGELIAYSGNTGRSTGPHLHFGLSHNGRWINPALKIVITKGLGGNKRRAFLSSVKIYTKKLENMIKSKQNSSKLPTLLDIEKSD
jgi:murein DD-endopeptidase MepM/ murein hydrolase activator NlpD